MKLQSNSNPIRSYGRTQGRPTYAQKRALITLYDKYQVRTQGNLFDPATLFNNPRPLLLEVGFGDGSTLIELAKLRPHWGLIGIDVYDPGIGKLLLGIEKFALQNVRVLRADAREFLCNPLQPKCFQEIQILFSDPWPKKRQQKRRLINRDFLLMICSKILTDGCLVLATDDPSYAQEMAACLSTIAGLELSGTRDDFTPRPHYQPLSKYESRALISGHKVFWLQAHNRNRPV